MDDEQTHLVAVNKESFEDVRELIKEYVKPTCKYCDVKITKDTFGFISRDITCCKDIICLISAMQEEEKMKSQNNTNKSEEV